MPELWLMLINSVSGENKTARMRIWRALKASGAVALRDGVYLLPESESARAVFVEQSQEVVAAGGMAYRGRTWATRERPWIDRVASAWLIRRFIDPKAKFLWLKKPKDCPKTAPGFDFDGAEFTHIGARVTFEVLAASFGLDNDRAIARLGALVHYLDVGGIPVPEAPGFAAIMAGARAQQANDDKLLQSMSAVLDALYTSYSQLPGGES